MTFLQQVANHYIQQVEKLNGTVFVFPNKRSLIHFRKEIKDAAEGAGIELPGIRMTSMSEFFQKMYGGETTDRIRLILALYETYRELNPSAESLDEFIHWGGVMISDFDNIDKYLADAKKIFVNVSDFREIQDTYEYLTENQRKAIEHFLAHFRDQNGRLTVNMDMESHDMKARFLKVWNLLGPLYERFKRKLDDSGMAYEGKIYRGCAEGLKNGVSINTMSGTAFPHKKRFVFVGLNALNECEKTALRALRNAGMAEFVWDYSSREIRDGRNRASHFLKKNVEEFPQAMRLDTEGLRRPDVTVISVASSVGQTKLAPKILAETTGCKPEETVFILPDENLLMPLMSAIPGEYDNINITMGYPMNKSAVYSLIKSIGTLQVGMKRVGEESYFHYKAVDDILSSSLLKKILVDEEKECVKKIKTDAKQFVPKSDFSGETLQAIFRDDVLLATTEKSENGENGNTRLADYLKSVLCLVTEHLGESDTEQVEAEFAKRYLDILASLSLIQIPVQVMTWLRLLDGLLQAESVPFEGDALSGLQVMGTLETRALDFKNVVILSANEDVFPHRSADNSFIPPELRKGFGLPTTEYQDAVWAYYFYRLLQRAEKVWLIYDSRTEGLLSGEESRYIKQLEYHFRFPVKRLTAVAPIAITDEEESIEKTQEDIDVLHRGHLSASTMQSYLTCPVKFYYQAVKGLRVEDEVTESLDASMIGTIFHAVMEHLYSGKSIVTPQDIRDMLADEEALRALIRKGICEKMRTPEVEGRNLVIEEVILEYIKGTLRHDLRLLGESGSEGFRILGLERYLKTTINGFPFIGFVDRIDTYKNGEIRIVDYKTGHVEDDDILITDSNAQEVVDKLFGEVNTGRPKIALQLFLYGLFAHESVVRQNETVVNSIYSTAKVLTTPLPDVPESPSFTELVRQRLGEKLNEVSDLSVPWKRTCDKKVCAICDFRSICGR